MPLKEAAQSGQDQRSTEDFVVLAATVAFRSPTNEARQRARPLRLDQMRGSSTTANEATRQFTQRFDVELRAKSALVIHRQTGPEIGTHRTQFAA
jgi:hypothetical protein